MLGDEPRLEALDDPPDPLQMREVEPSALPSDSPTPCSEIG